MTGVQTCALPIFEDLLAHPEITRFYTESLNKVQNNFAAYEQVKRFTLLAKPFTMESGELTNTLKIRRRVINESYKEVIDSMYSY